MTTPLSRSLILTGLLCFLPFSVTGDPPLPAFEQPALITSAGQSAEVQLASVLSKRAGLAATLNKLAGPQDLESSKTLVMVLGTSLKGLGAAGLDMAQEKSRVKALIDRAAETGIPILALHLGGEARRGPLSDELIEAFLPAARMAIVVRTGNADGLFTRICKDQGIALVEVDKTVEALVPLKTAFGLE